MDPMEGKTHVTQVRGRRPRGVELRGRPGVGHDQVHTADFDHKGHTRRASPEEPQHEIESDRTDHVAAHKRSALRLVDDDR